MTALPKFTMKQLLDAGVHFGHKTMRWNPAMAPYIYGERNNIHIINLQKTVPLLYRALEVARDVAAQNGRVLFVGTKPQAASVVAEAAKRCGQYYVNHRWLGGTLTNWPTVSQSIKTMNEIEIQLNDPELQLSKKERLQLTRKLEKLEKTLGGIREMGGKPNLLFVLDTTKEDIAVLEAKKLGIPVIAIADTNSSPENIDYLIPGNDDASRSLELYCNLMSDAILSGLQISLGRGGAANQSGAEKSPPQSAEEITEAVKARDEAEKAAKSAQHKKGGGKKTPAKEAPKKAEVVKKGPRKPSGKAEDAGAEVKSIAEVKADKPAADAKTEAEKKAASK